MALRIFVSMTISFILIGHSAFSQKVSNDWDKMELKGKVKSINESSYIMTKRSGVVQKQYRSKWTIYKFNEKGYKTEVREFEPYDGNIEEILVYKYSSAGKLIERNEYDKDSTLRSNYIFKYDDNGKHFEDSINSNGKITKYIYKYDDKGNCIGLKGINNNGIQFTEYTYEYDTRGNKIEERWYDGKNSLISKYIYKYDLKGQLIEEHRYNKNQDLEGISRYKYDNNGNLVEHTWGGASGNIIEREIYILDEKFNWIKIICTELDEPNSVTEREYEYFN